MRRAAAALALTAAVGALSSPASGARPQGFSEPVTVVPALRAGTGEPRLTTTRDGTVVISAHFQGVDCATGAPSDRGRLCVWRSRDGRRFALNGGEPTGQQGNDVDIAVMPESQTMVLSAMTNLGLGTGIGGTTVSRSADGGRSWTGVTAANGSIANDRPWLLVDDERNLLLTYADLGSGQIHVVRSADGGASFGLPTVVTPLPAQPVVSMNGLPFKNAARDELVIPYGSGSSPTCPVFTGVAGCLDTFTLARSRDGGATWSTGEVVRLPAGTGATSVVTAAADGAGREYLAFGTVSGFSGTGPGTESASVLLYVSERAGQPFRMQRLSAKGTSSMVPTVAAAGDGTVAVSWYTTPFTDAGAAERPWRLTVATSRNGGRSWLRSAPPQPAAAYVGTVSGHQQSVWDVNGIAIDGRNRLHLAWTSLLGGRDGSPGAVLYSRVQL